MKISFQFQKFQKYIQKFLFPFLLLSKSKKTYLLLFTSRYFVVIKKILIIINSEVELIVLRYYVGRHIVIRALRTLKPGEVIAENYGPIFTKRCLKDRQRSLAGRYWFRCLCLACTQDWPTFDNLTNHSARLR